MRFRRLHSGFGAEVIGLDLLTLSADEMSETLRVALDEHQLLVFRGGRHVPPERHIEIASWFGPVIDYGGDGQRWTVLHNNEASGRLKLPFHSDLSYTDSPIQIITLQATALPKRGTSTAYVSGIHGWATLSAELRDRVAGFTLRHRYDSKTLQDMPIFVADHPLRLVHPRTGESVLYVTEFHADRIYDVDPEESQRLIHELQRHLYAPERVYEHEWKLWDFVVWDNLAVQHARREEASLADGARALQRVQIADVSFPEVIERARKRQQRELKGSALETSG